MRDIVVFAAVLAIAVAALARPWIGMLGWTWVGLMNPHRLAWGFAQQMPVAAMVGGATLLGFLFTKQKRFDIFTPASTALLLFCIWILIVFPFSFYPDFALSMLNRVWKILLMIFIAMMLIVERKHIMYLVWVIVASLSYFGVKGGLFTIAKGGEHRVWGPDDSFIAGNNELALALVMTIPLMRFLQLQLTKRWQRNGMVIAMVLMAASAIGSHSRGALLAIACMSVVLMMRSRHKFGFGVLIVAVGVALVAFMPDHWSSRMGTIQTYEEDASAMGRINAWHMAYNIATENVFGGGFELYTREVYLKYAPEPTSTVLVAHSIYFQVLGELGFIGLLLYLSMWALLWRELGRIRKRALTNPERQWVADLAAMSQVSLVGYLVGGAFLSLAYFDLPYNLIVISVALGRWVRDQDKVAAQAPAPAAGAANLTGAAHA